MKYFLTIWVGLIVVFSCSGQSRIDFLSAHNQDLRAKNFKFNPSNFKIIGFGAYHGSTKTEEVELLILASLIKQNSIKYYLPETDFSTAHFFNQYLNNGDTLLLKELISIYGKRVPQDASIETYNKWVKLKVLNDNLTENKKLTVIGIDKIADLSKAVKYLDNLVITDSANPFFRNLNQLAHNDTSSFSAYYDSYAKNKLRTMMSIYEKNKLNFAKYIRDTSIFNYIINDIKKTFDGEHPREQTIYENYIELGKIYNFKTNPQFVRFGFFHLEKSRAGAKGYPSFFTRLIENEVYSKNEVLSVIGYLTKSKVLWNQKYNKAGNYKGYTTKAGYGIGDYWKEYFRGIKYLKKSKLSDITLFKLNSINSPYNQQPDLIEVKLFFKPKNGAHLKEMNTLDFIDYAVLISNSKASIPIQEL